MNCAYFRPAIVVIKVAVKNVVDYLYRIVALAREVGLKFFKFIGNA
jgi:hypothetical protein